MKTKKFHAITHIPCKTKVLSLNIQFALNKSRKNQDEFNPTILQLSAAFEMIQNSFGEKKKSLAYPWNISRNPPCNLQTPHLSITTSVKMSSRVNSLSNFTFKFLVKFEERTTPSSHPFRNHLDRYYVAICSRVCKFYLPTFWIIVIDDKKGSLENDHLYISVQTILDEQWFPYNFWLHDCNFVQILQIFLWRYELNGDVNK